MKILDINELLQAHPYPGRGIVLGRSADGQKAVIIYFIMGRSENSRNRIFEATGDGIRTRAYDESKMVDPSLIIYHPVRQVGEVTVVTNGDQTDTIRDSLLAGKSYIDALRTRCYEPDGPNYTPRIYEYDAPLAGEGRFIHTYQENAEPLPSFEGEPRRVSVSAPDAETLASQVWASLNEDNKVSLFVQYIHLATGERETVILNKHGEQAHAASKVPN